MANRVVHIVFHTVIYVYTFRDSPPPLLFILRFCFCYFLPSSCYIRTFHAALPRPGAEAIVWVQQHVIRWRLSEISFFSFPSSCARLLLLFFFLQYHFNNFFCTKFQCFRFQMDGANHQEDAPAVDPGDDKGVIAAKIKIKERKDYIIFLSVLSFRHLSSRFIFSV